MGENIVVMIKKTEPVSIQTLIDLLKWIDGWRWHTIESLIENITEGEYIPDKIITYRDWQSIMKSALGKYSLEYGVRRIVEDKELSWREKTELLGELFIQKNRLDALNTAFYELRDALVLISDFNHTEIEIYERNGYVDINEIVRINPDEEVMENEES